MVENAVNERVSDIHLIPLEKEYAVYFRKAGALVFFDYRSFDWGRRCIAHFKFLANLDVAEKRKPQSGSVHYTVKEHAIELRLSTIMNVHLLESLVIRVIQPMLIQTQLNAFFPLEFKKLQQLVQRKSGLVLFSGPVGSGKTTTIYQLLRDRIEYEMLQVITMEDPVEIVEPRFLQAEVNVAAGITYNELIKASLRHHPDILVIGEIRDEETAKMVIRGALTGHLMVATIHAKNAIGVIGRLQELGITRQQMEQTIIGIVSQRLVPALYGNQLNKFNRCAVWELMENEQVVASLNQQVFSMTTLNQKLRKAWGCGYVSTQSYYKYEVV